MGKETLVTYGLRDIKAIHLRCTRDGCDGVERIPVDNLSGSVRLCPKCRKNFTTAYTLLMVDIQKLVGIGPDAGEQLDYEVRLEYPVED